ncbi:MAG: hypothetical protein LBG96_16155 [Tannerella sp.]|jgi:hypothetical protein|nr:hypothetical protein [Tannerella sp.]
METTTMDVKFFPKYPDERYDQFVGATSIVEGLQGRCLSMLHHGLEFPEDKIPVEAWSKKFGEIFNSIRLSDEKTIQRAYKLKPLLNALTLDYILNHPDGWKSL